MLHLLKNIVIDKYLNQFAHKELYVLYKTMLKKMVGLTSNYSNIHGFMNDNINSYTSIVMDAMKMNQDYSTKGSCNTPLKEESIIDTTRSLNFQNIIMNYYEIGISTPTTPYLR